MNGSSPSIFCIKIMEIMGPKKKEGLMQCQSMQPSVHAKGEITWQLSIEMLATLPQQRLDTTILAVNSGYQRVLLEPAMGRCCGTSQPVRSWEAGCHRGHMERVGCSGLQKSTVAVLLLATEQDGGMSTAT